MPKQISESELDVIRQAVNRFDEGASIDDIQGVLEIKMSRLAANIPLIREKLSPLSFVDVPKKAYIDDFLSTSKRAEVSLKLRQKQA